MSSTTRTGSTEASWSVTVKTVDPSSESSSVSGNTGYIRAIILFLSPEDSDGNATTSDYDDVGDDVISVSTDQGTSKQEGDATAKMTVTLNNNNYKYREKFIPQLTMVLSFVEIERNVISGNNLTVVHEGFPLFFGRVQEINMDHKTCIIECADESSTMESSAEFDLTFFPDKTSSERVQEILDAMDPSPLLEIERISDGTHEVEIESYALSSQSAQSVTSQSLKDMSLDWSVPSDQIGRLLIFGDTLSWKENTDNPDLSEFIISPGDSESIIGYANDFDVIADGVISTSGTDKNVMSSNSSDSTKHIEDSEGIEKYGKVTAKKYSVPYLSTQTQIDNYAENLKSIYTAYADRVLTPSVTSKIPMLNSKMNYTLPSFEYNSSYKNSSQYATSTVGKNSTPIKITVKVLRKQVDFDSSGVVSKLECKRWSEEPEAGEEIKDNWQRKSEVLTSYEGTSTYNLYIYNPETGAVWIYAGATEEQKNAFINDKITPVDWDEWNKEYTSYTQDTPFGKVTDGYLVGSSTP